MTDYNIYISLKKLFNSLVLERYNVEGEIRIIDYSTDQYVNMDETKEFPIIGGIEVIYYEDLTRFHNVFDTYDEEYNEFFSSGDYDDRFEMVLKYLPELPLYHDYYFIHTNKEAFLNKLPEMQDEINSLLKSEGEECFVSNIIWEDEHTEKSKGGVTRLIIENTCGDNIKGVYIHEKASELYDDMVWLSRTY